MNLKVLSILAVAVMLGACGNNVKEIEPQKQEEKSDGRFGHFHPDEPEGDFLNTWHNVRVVNVLESVKYSYLEVAEAGSKYWIATLKDEYKPGESYRLKSGLLKTNFRSVEHDRTFEELYLVSEIYPVETDAQNVDAIDELNFKNEVPASIMENVTAIADILANPEKYSGKVVRISGEVVKANANIMNRNWLHIQDGTANDYDFVLTTNVQIPVGHRVGFEGVISTDRDFGAGYTYEVIMEDAKLIK